jgi:hypothetical protein
LIAGKIAEIHHHIHRFGYRAAFADRREMNAAFEIGKSPTDDQRCIVAVIRAARCHIEELRALVAARPRAPIQEDTVAHPQVSGK